MSPVREQSGNHQGVNTPPLAVRFPAAVAAFELMCGQPVVQLEPCADRLVEAVRVAEMLCRQRPQDAVIFYACSPDGAAAMYEELVGRVGLRAVASPSGDGFLGLPGRTLGWPLEVVHPYAKDVPRFPDLAIIDPAYLHRASSVTDRLGRCPQFLLLGDVGAGVLEACESMAVMAGRNGRQSKWGDPPVEVILAGSPA